MDGGGKMKRHAAILKDSPSSPDTATAAVRRERVLFDAGLIKGASKAPASAHAQGSYFHVLALTVDHGLVAAGIAAAVGSASFAGFMMTRDNSHPMFGGIEHLMIFAQPIGGAHSNHEPTAKPHEKRAVDYNTTGSIAQPAKHDVEHNKATDGARPRFGAQIDPASATMKGYVLRLARKGGVSIEGPGGSYPAAPGTTLPDAGRILSLENRNGRWVVTTENGRIAEPGL